MFRYKICKACKENYKLALTTIILLTPILYFNIKFNNNDIAIHILLILSTSIIIVPNILHYREHQRKQFNKIKAKFGVK